MTDSSFFDTREQVDLEFQTIFPIMTEFTLDTAYAVDLLPYAHIVTKMDFSSTPWKMVAYKICNIDSVWAERDGRIYVKDDATAVLFKLRYG